MKKFILILIILCSVSVSAYDVVINEIMYDPPGNDNNREYVELYSEEEVNLTGWIFEDSMSSDVLELLQWKDSTYILIVEEGFNLTYINSSVYSAGASLGNGLHNTADSVVIRDLQNSIVDSVSYTKDDGGGGNNEYSLCVDQHALIECIATPGEENFINQTNQSSGGNSSGGGPSYNFNGLRINEVLPDPQGNDGELMPYGEWVELSNSGDDVDVARLELCDKSEHCVLVSNAHVMGDTFLRKGNYLIVYMNGQSILNNNGYEEVRLLFEEDIIDKMSYSGSTMDKSWAFIDNGYYVTTPTPGQENYLHAGEDEEEKVDVSYFSIEKIVPNDTLSFGELFTITISAYKGDTNKKKVYLFVDKVGKKSSFELADKHTSYEFSVPFVTPMNCDRKYKEGIHTVVVEGFELRKERKINLTYHRSCPKEESVTHKASESVINKASQKSLEAKETATKEMEGTTSTLFKANSGSILGYVALVFILSIISGFAYYLLKK